MFWPLTAAEHALDEADAGARAGDGRAQGEIQGRHAEVHPKQWELYRKHKVNPMSGCLPMMIQMPVFIGFFTMIRSAIELRGAHFLWVGGFVQAGHAVHDSGHVHFSPRSVQPAAAADGRRDVVAIASDAAVAGHGSDAGKNDALHAADVSGVSLQLFLRPGALLTVNNLLASANQADEKPARPGGADAQIQH